MHFLIFLHLADQFLGASQIDEVIYAKFWKTETDRNEKFIKILTSVILYGLCGDINSHSLCMSST